MDMGELPEGMDMPKSKITTPHPSASVILSRERVGGHEILLGHRVSELPAFPDVWSFPGGGISRVDRAAAESHPEWLSKRGGDRVSAFALLRFLRGQRRSQGTGLWRQVRLAGVDGVGRADL